MVWECMKKNRDLVSVLKSNNMRITPPRRLLLQFILDNKSKHVTAKDMQDYLDARIPNVDRSTVYRNVEAFKRLDILQELNLPTIGRCFQYVFEKKVHHFYICKSCGHLNRGNNSLFLKIEKALKDVHGFEKANLSVVFYGYCSKCRKA